MVLACVYADNRDMLGGSVHTVKKDIEGLVVASKGIGQEVNGEQTEHMVRSRDQHAVRIATQK
jgi:hypothetical protein